MKTRLAAIWLVLFAFTAAADRNSFQRVEVIREVDSGEGPVREFIARYTYDRGKLARVVTDRDLNVDGTNDYHSVVIYTYNRRGIRIASTSESSSTLESRLDRRSRTTYEYDEQGDIVSTLLQTDSDVDGTVDFISRVTLTYDERGNWVRRVVESDREADGAWDNSTTSTRTYDARDNLLSELRESDSDVDGRADYVIATRYTLDRRGNAVRAVTAIDYEADGVVDGTERRTSTYDRRGNVLSSLSESYDADGGAYGTFKANYSYVYDTRGNLTRLTVAHDFEADGVVDVTEITTYRYARVSGSRGDDDDDD